MSCGRYFLTELFLFKKIFVHELLTESFDVFRQNFFKMAGITLAIWFPANFAIQFLGEPWWVRVLAGAGSMLFSIWSVASFTYMTLAYKAGERCSVFKALGRGLFFYWPIIRFYIVPALKILGGLLLFIVPGVYLIMRYTMVIPIIVTEGPHSQEPDERSYGMTRGHISLIFFCILAFITAPFILNIFVNAFVKYMGYDLAPWAGALIACFFDFLTSTFSIAMFLIYLHLVNLKLARIKSEQAFAGVASVA